MFFNAKFVVTSTKTTVTTIGVRQDLILRHHEVLQTLEEVDVDVYSLYLGVKCSLGPIYHLRQLDDGPLAGVLFVVRFRRHIDVF